MSSNITSSARQTPGQKNRKTMHKFNQKLSAIYLQCCCCLFGFSCAGLPHTINMAAISATKRTTISDDVTDDFLHIRFQQKGTALCARNFRFL
jgi:hypothetical protein